MRSVGISVALVVAACGASAPAEAPEPGLAAGAYDFAGSCSWGRGVGELSQYRLKLRVRGHPGALADVHSLARIPRSPQDRRRGEIVLGRVPVGAVLRGQGPLHGGADSAEAVYAVAVRGVRGRVCRGYMRQSSVEVID